MNQQYSKKERQHLERIKQLHCSVCDAPPISEAHHIRQNEPYLCVALCKDCHDALHGKKDKALWRIHKMDELLALSVTLRRLF